MAEKFVRLFCLALMAGMVATPTAANSQAPAAESAIAPFVARAVSPRVHLLSTPADYFGPVIGNVTLIEQADGFVVIDSGLSAANGRAVVAYARSVSPKPIKAVAITHWHNDHPQGVSAIRDAFPAVRVIATAATEASMLSVEANGVGFYPDPKIDAEMGRLVAGAKDSMQKLLDDPATAPDRKERLRKALAEYDDYLVGYAGTYIVPPTETFERELLIDDTDLPVRLMHLGRSNTDGDLIAWLPKQKIVASGDIVVSPVPFGFFSYPGDWIQSIGKLKALGFTTLIPGHGDPQTDSSYLDKLVTAMTDIRAKVAPLAKQGVPIGEVRAKLDLDAITALFGDTPRNRINFENLFITPMIPNAYKEARGEPIIQGEGNPKPEYSHTPPKPSSRKHQS